MSLIDQIKDEVDLDMFFRVFGIDRPWRDHQHTIRCFFPGHNDQHPSATVYPEKQRVWCFTCNKGGDVIDLTAIMMSTTLTKAVEFWADRLNLKRGHVSTKKDKRWWERDHKTWRKFPPPDLPPTEEELGPILKGHDMLCAWGVKRAASSILVLYLKRVIADLQQVVVWQEEDRVGPGKTTNRRGV